MSKKILGIGNAIVDVFVKVDDKFLLKNNLTKGSMKLIEKSEFEKLKNTIKIENAKNTQEISKIYIDWIDSLGDVKECKTCKTINSEDSFDNNFNLSWTQDSKVFSDELTRKLKYIENNRFQGK